MRFLRGRWFLLACLAAVVAGVEIGGRGDDPGSDETPNTSSSFLAIHLDGREGDLGRFEIDADLKQRFKYYVALKRKP
jgi:hypothetical protein